MKTKITATVPTIYQYTSLQRLLGLQPQKNMAGSFTTERDFETVREARAWLRDRAWNLYEGDKQAIKENSGKDYLRWDAATAYIESKN